MNEELNLIEIGFSRIKPSNYHRVDNNARFYKGDFYNSTKITLSESIVESSITLIIDERILMTENSNGYKRQTIQLSMKQLPYKQGALMISSTILSLLKTNKKLALEIIKSEFLKAVENNTIIKTYE